MIVRGWMQWALLGAALLMAAFYLFPLYWMYVTSLKGQTEIFANPPTFWPNAASFDAYVRVWTTRNVGMFMGNSLIIATSVTAITVVLGCGCAYVLARYRNVWIRELDLNLPSGPDAVKKAGK